MLLGSQEASPLTCARMMMMLFGHSRGQVKNLFTSWFGKSGCQPQAHEIKEKCFNFGQNLAE